MALLNMRVIRNKRNVVEPSESGWAELFMGAFLSDAKRHQTTGEI
jgi:hypothetical protein